MLCSLQLVMAAGDRDNKKKRKRLKRKAREYDKEKKLRVEVQGIKRKGMDVWRQGETTLKITGLTQRLVGKMTEGL